MGLKVFFLKAFKTGSLGIVSATRTQNELFEKTRWQLALWYGGILGTVLFLCGLGIYEALIYSQKLTIDRELKSIADRLHESFEPILKEPGKLEVAIYEILPDLCLEETECFRANSNSRDSDNKIEPMGYYVRLLDVNQHLLAVSGRQPYTWQMIEKEGQWQNSISANGDRYRQISVEAHTRDFQIWGYIQVGQSLKAFDDHIANLLKILLMGLPAIVLLLTGTSWWLAGKAMRPIYQSYRQIQQFTTDAAHELRTPLAAIRATLESTLMMPQIGEADARETLLTLRRQNLRLSNLVADLLMLCRFDSGIVLSAKKESILVDELIKDITDDFAALALAAKLELSLRISVWEPLKVMGDREQLYRLISNILSNAIRYTPAGGKVTAIVERNLDRVLIHIVDTGIGIAKEEQTRIFDRFYRVTNERTSQVSGSGLGLAIAWAIASAHQGHILVESELDKGSKFTVCLPLIFQ